MTHSIELGLEKARLLICARDHHRARAGHRPTRALQRQLVTIKARVAALSARAAGETDQ